MTEVWLRPNSRALAVGAIMPMLLLIVGLWVALRIEDQSTFWKVTGWVLAGLSATMLLMLGVQMRQPRLAYRDGSLLVYLQAGHPIRLPVEVAEAFLIGRGPTLLPTDRGHRQETTNLMLRLAESATDWAHRETKPALGSWCGGYITFRGTWCEPLSVDVAHRLNARLAEVQKSATAAERS